MATKKDAYRKGYDAGFGIAEQNFLDVFRDFSKRTGGVVLDDRLDEIIELSASHAMETESEHYRQFTPFEFTAKEFNDSRNPDVLWEAYGLGVHEGALAGSLAAAKDLLTKAWVYGRDFPEDEK